MTSRRHQILIRGSDSLSRAPGRAIGVSFPLPVSARLDELVGQAELAGNRTSRKELLAALVLAAADDPDALDELVRNYRRARVVDAGLAAAEDDVVTFAANVPGRPGRISGEVLSKREQP
jgi:hypothetical protein